MQKSCARERSVYSVNIKSLQTYWKRMIDVKVYQNLEAMQRDIGEIWLNNKDKEIEDLRTHIAKLEERVKLMDHFFMMVGNHRLKLERTLIHHGIPLPPYSCKED